MSFLLLYMLLVFLWWLVVVEEDEVAVWVLVLLLLLLLLNCGSLSWSVMFGVVVVVEEESTGKPSSLTIVGRFDLKPTMEVGLKLFRRAVRVRGSF